MTSFYRLHLLFYLLVLSIAYILFELEADFIHIYILYIVSFNIFVDVIFKFLNKSGRKNNTIINIIISTFFRVFLSLIFIIFFQYFGGESLLIFILNFLSVYLLFIIFEITILLLNLHHIK